MRPAVVTAVLLLVGILNTGTVVHGASRCDRGWMYVGRGSCIRYFTSPKSFIYAEEYCRFLKGAILSHQHVVDNDDIIYLLNRLMPNFEPFWGERKRDCKEVNFMGNRLQWNSIPCSEFKPFVCIKKA